MCDFRNIFLLDNFGYTGLQFVQMIDVELVDQLYMNDAVFHISCFLQLLEVHENKVVESFSL